MTIFGRFGFAKNGPVSPDITNKIEDNAIVSTGGKRPAYVIITPSMLAYNEAFATTRASNVWALRSALADSPDWHLIIDRAGVIIYKLPPIIGNARGGVIP